MAKKKVKKIKCLRSRYSILVDPTLARPTEAAEPNGRRAAGAFAKYYAKNQGRVWAIFQGGGCADKIPKLPTNFGKMPTKKENHAESTLM